MLDADSQRQTRPGAAEAPRGVVGGSVRERLAALRAELPAEESVRLLAIVDGPARTPESLRDALSTRLMESFRCTSGRGTFGLLYELNSEHLLVQVAHCLRRYGSKSDPRDVLQEVFFNVYRYPHRFNAEREDAFRVWTAMIVRNTVLKHLRAQGRAGRHEVAFEDLSEQPETRAQRPEEGLADQEAQAECGRVYLTYLHLYLRFYSMLGPRERAAIHMVEVEELSYRSAADRLGIKLENLKMVIFRARRKIHRAMQSVFEGQPAECRPARDPRATLVGEAPECRMAGEEDDHGE